MTYRTGIDGEFIFLSTISSTEHKHPGKSHKWISNILASVVHNRSCYHCSLAIIYVVKRVSHLCVLVEYVCGSTQASSQRRPCVRVHDLISNLPFQTKRQRLLELTWKEVFLLGWIRNGGPLLLHSFYYLPQG